VAREGIGDLLAEGVKKAAEKVGQGSEAFAIHVKGLEWTGYECRNAPSMMLAYMTADIGAHHSRAWVLGHDMAGAWTNVNDLVQSGGTVERQPPAQVRKESADYVIDSQHTRPLFDALGICRLQLMELGFEVENYAELFLLHHRQKTVLGGDAGRFRTNLEPDAQHFGAGNRRFRTQLGLSARTVFHRTGHHRSQRGLSDPQRQAGAAAGLVLRGQGLGCQRLPTRDTLLRLDLGDVAEVWNPKGCSTKRASCPVCVI
jgi:hypothetical protein